MEDARGAAVGRGSALPRLLPARGRSAVVRASACAAAAVGWRCQTSGALFVLVLLGVARPNPARSRGTSGDRRQRARRLDAAVVEVDHEPRRRDRRATPGRRRRSPARRAVATAVDRDRLDRPDRRRARCPRRRGRAAVRATTRTRSRAAARAEKLGTHCIWKPVRARQTRRRRSRRSSARERSEPRPVSSVRELRSRRRAPVSDGTARAVGVSSDSQPVAIAALAVSASSAKATAQRDEAPPPERAAGVSLRRACQILCDRGEVRWECRHGETSPPLMTARMILSARMTRMRAVGSVVDIVAATSAKRRSPITRSSSARR